jgi:hypothetical protein
MFEQVRIEHGNSPGYEIEEIAQIKMILNEADGS